MVAKKTSVGSCLHEKIAALILSNGKLLQSCISADKYNILLAGPSVNTDEFLTWGRKGDLLES